ncbi:MAG: YceI family protein [Bacteroidales bacterium]|nr:MAG: YceI family protein [Bacteroidales bacterium]
MKKTIIFLFVIFTGMTILFTKCSKDDETVVATISGKVTYISASGATMDAGGAVITVYKGTSAGEEYMAIVANETGMYKVERVDAGDYFLVATYNTENVNNLKSDGVDGTTFKSDGVVVSIGSSDVVQDITLGNVASAGTNVISTTDGTWSKESHSKITWKTLYHGEAAQLVGGFNNFGIKQLDFDEADPASTVIKGWVQLSSINTFEPGRDALGHCVTDDLGVEYNPADTAVDGTLNASAVDASTDTAWFNSTSVQAYGNGYLAKGDLIFKGVTKQIDMFFVYNGTYLIPGRTGGSDPFAVFEGEFTFDAANDYNVDYSGGDEIEVNIHLQMKGPHIE